MLLIGFTLENGETITKTPLFALVELMGHREFKSVKKINMSHLIVRGTERMKVKRAAALLSHNVATALKRYFEDTESQNLSHFIQLVNDWFDIMNSRVSSSDSPYKKLYTNSDIQLSKLDEVYQYFDTMVPIGKKSQQVFQKGILISILSIKMLFHEMNERYGMTHIITTRINQDALENFFSEVRRVGGMNTHPSPLNSIYRIRLLILGIFSHF